MSRRDKLSKKLNYPIVVNETKGGYILSAPPLPCVGEGETLDLAYQNLNENKRRYVEEMISLGKEKSIPLPRPVQVQGAERNLVLFFVKLLIVFLFVLASAEVVRMNLGNFMKLLGR